MNPLEHSLPGGSFFIYKNKFFVILAGILFIVKLFIPFTPYLSKFVLKTIMENHNYNNQKMIEILKIQPTSFEDTLKKTIKFFEERKK